LEVIEERAATGLVVERPSEGVLHEAGLVFFGGDLPEFLQPDAEFLLLAPLTQAEFSDQLLGERTANAFADQRVFAVKLHAGRVIRPAASVTLDAHVAGGDTPDGAVLVIENLDGREARIDLDAKRLSPRREPAADIAE